MISCKLQSNIPFNIIGIGYCFAAKLDATGEMISIRSDRQNLHELLQSDIPCQLRRIRRLRRAVLN